MKLTNEQVKSLTDKYKHWHLIDGKLVSERSFHDFKEAMNFVEKVAKLAEKQNHHPDIAVRYNHVTLELYSHDVGGITERDERLIEAIER